MEDNEEVNILRESYLFLRENYTPEWIIRLKINKSTHIPVAIEVIYGVCAVGEEPEKYILRNIYDIVCFMISDYDEIGTIKSINN